MTSTRKTIRVLGCSVVLLLLFGFVGQAPAQTALSVYTDPSAFYEATSGMATPMIVNFDELDASPLGDTYLGRTPFDGSLYAPIGFTFASPHGYPLFISPGGLFWNESNSLSVGRFPYDPAFDEPTGTPLQTHDDLVVTLAHPCGAIGFTLVDNEQTDLAGEFVQFIDADGGIIAQVSLPPNFDSHRAFVGIVSVDRPVASIKILEAANDGDDVNYDDFTCFPAGPKVDIDIKPGSFPNSINPESSEVIPVAIRTTDTFDATTVDPTTVLFGPTGTEAAPVQSALEDVDGDGDTDMILHFKTRDTDIEWGDTSAVLRGRTLSGQAIGGSDSIRTENPREIIIDIVADIDGRSQLILRGNTAQWHHLDWAAPGREEFTDFPTTINAVDWYPIWPDVPDAENRDCDCLSDVFTGVAPDLPAQPMEIGLEILGVDRPDTPWEDYGTVAIVQFPMSENDFTTILEFDDNGPIGSAFYHVRLRIVTLQTTVDIDIKPGSFPNSIDPESSEVIPVAILTADTLDASTVDPTTVLFGPTGTEAAPVQSALQDVDGDGDIDMVLHFKTQDTDISCGDTSASLTGKTFDGQAVRGSDSIQTPSCPCVQPPAGLVSWWPGDGNEIDIVKGNDGILQGGASFGDGLVAQAFALDGIDDWVEVPHAANLNFGTNDFTVDLWVKFDTTDGEQILIEKWIQKYDEPSLGWTLTKLEDNVILIGCSDMFGLYAVPPPIQTDTWNFVAVTRAGNTFTIYWNGIALGSKYGESNLDTTASLKLGHRCSPEDTPGCEDVAGFYLDGLIDEVEIFNRALSEAEIKSIFAAGSAGKCKAIDFVGIDIDIKPGRFPNRINPKSRWVIPVAILTTDTFDATTVDPTTVHFGRTGTEAAPVQSALEDADGDGDTDMILHFKTRDADIKWGNTSASLTGETVGGQAIKGSDSIRTVWCKHHWRHHCKHHHKKAK
jgi:hypothetical protein